MTDETPTVHWHALAIHATLDKLGSSAAGLKPSEAKARLDQFGPNRLCPPQRRGPLVRLLLQFHNILIYLLLVAVNVLWVVEVEKWLARRVWRG